MPDAMKVGGLLGQKVLVWGKRCSASVCVLLGLCGLQKPHAGVAWGPGGWAAIVEGAAAWVPAELSPPISLPLLFLLQGFQREGNPGLESGGSDIGL